MDLHHFVKDLNKSASRVPKRQECDLDKLKEYLTIRHSVKWAQKRYHHIEILLSSHGEEKKNPERLLWGVKGQEAHANIYIGPNAQSKEKLLLGHGKNPPSAMDVAEDKGSGLLLRVTLRVIPWNRVSTKTKKDNRRNGNIQGKAAIIALSALYLAKPYFSAFTTTPNDFGKGLMGQVSTL